MGATSCWLRLRDDCGGGVVSQYDNLDSLILAELKSGSRTFAFLNAGLVRCECDRLERAGCGESFRILDRRLQALRKKAKIEFDTKNGWGLRSVISKAQP